jgi:hypothetical protein
MSDTSTTESEWTVRKLASVLEPGDQFIFSDELGGEGDAVTVESATNVFGTVEVETEELDFTLELTERTFVTIVGSVDA